MTTVVQVAPAIGPGTGAESVAYNLEREFQRAGMTTGRFTMTEAKGSWLPEPGPGWRGKAALALRVVWFSTVGTGLARRYLRRRADVVAICHNDVVAGDIYVNHGILQRSMRARGNYAWRMARNPLHLFIAARDHYRYRSAAHRVVVNLMSSEDRDLRATYPHLRPRTVVIGNGVDVDHYRPPTKDERTAARARLSLEPGDLAVAFVGHEFDRKGLYVILDALAGVPQNVKLVVVGGTRDMVDAVHRSLASRGLAGRVLLVGQAHDVVPYLHAADVFALPSAYESYGLVILEAMACALPVVVTDVGCAPDVVKHGVNGLIVDLDPGSVRDAIIRLARADRHTMGIAALRTAELHSWDRVAAEYVALVEEVISERMTRNR